jgi:hypothetical protein
MNPQTIEQLKQPFAAEDHRERELPGGGKWMFIPWQKIRDRLDQVCPDWQVAYGLPTYLDKYCCIACTLTIEGVSRQAYGNAEIELLSRNGKDMSRGTPIERAIADAFKNAAEQFGIGAYLDNQEFVVRYLNSQGDYRGYANSARRKEIRNTAAPAQTLSGAASRTFSANQNHA